MKQKNLILMVIAVGCGLIAAVLTAKMTAGQAPPQQEGVEVIVTVKDLNPPAKFTKDSLKDLVKRKKMPQESIPDGAITDENELLDMTLIRPVNAGIFIQRTDVSKHGEMPVPAGKDGIVSLKFQLEKVTPFIKPTSRINLLGVVQHKVTGDVSSTVLVPNMHVMAVDAEYIPAPGAPMGKMQVQVITFAVTNDESLLLQMAQKASVDLSCLLIKDSGTASTAVPPEWSFEGAQEWIRVASGGTTSAPPMQTNMGTPAPMAQTVKIPVAAMDLPAGTELTSEILNTKFKMVEQLTAPENAVMELNSLVGKYLAKEVSANSFIPKGSVTATLPMAKPGGDDAATPKPTPTIPDVKPEAPKVVKKRETHDVTTVTPSGTKVSRYEMQDNGKWKLLGEVQSDGTIKATEGASPSTPVKEKADEKADEKSPDRRFS